MKKTIKETRELMNKINRFLSEDFNIAKQAAENFQLQNAEVLDDVLGPRWQTQGGEWANDSKNEDWLHMAIWEFCNENYPEYMGDEEKSENFVQSVMSNIG
jgi:hypothetical protein